ncbi:MAG TPA: ATP-binding protein [Anaerolineae bacterium]|nr:ATP-binding protein [Anaerolineae bacterium]
MSIEFLRQLPLFASLSEADLEWLFHNAEPITIGTGETLIEEGGPGDSLYIVVDGEFEITKRSGQHDIAVALRAPGEVIGEMALLDHAPRSATVRALRDSQLLKIHDDTFHQLLANSPTAALAILHTVVARLRQNEALLHEREKLAGLGTLAAGLAHELNNPAAASRRAALQLREALVEWERVTLELNACSFNPHQAATVHDLRDEIVKRATTPVQLDPLARSDREGDVQGWLEDQAIEPAWELAPTLVSFGWEIDSLDQLTGQFSREHWAAITRWLAAGGSVYMLLDEVSKSAERISEIVKAVKSYAYLDQAPIQEVDVHEGLENTLVILRHKLKPGIQLTREYATDLPHIEAYASELNQVWTNIIDNAIDAMNGQGELLIRTYRKDGQVVVELADNGPGIPPEIQSRVFEPFFTTKPPGVGTGLGLNIAYNIVQTHLGQIKVTSRPGETCFQVTLPIQLKQTQQA